MARIRSARAPYVLELARHPITWGSAAFATLFGAISHSVLAVPMVGAVALATWISGARPRTQQRLDEVRRERCRRERREQRETRLEDANVRRGELCALTDLADAITRCDPQGSEQLDLEGLLDHYTEVALAIAKCRRFVESSEIERVLARHARIGTRTRAGAIMQRRLDQVAACHARRRALEDELAAISELFVMLAERAVNRVTQPLRP